MSYYGTPKQKATKAAYDKERRGPMTLEEKQHRAGLARGRERGRTPAFYAWRETYLRSPEYRAKQLAHTRKMKYGITSDEMLVLLEVQNGHCAICPSPLNGDGKTHVDHDHLSGRVRGLLCRGCNLALGNVGDDAARLLAAADYLQRGR